MKPSCPVAVRRDYEIRPVPLSDGAAFIRTYHYAKGCANTAVLSMGAFRGGVLVATALWLPPTVTCARTVHEDWRRVLALSRLAVAPGEPQNVASMLIGACLRSLRREGRWAALVTFADESQQHTGKIYRATNWIYQGRTKPESRWVAPDGRQVSRLSTKSRTRAEMEALGYRLAGKFSKHRFAIALQGALLPFPRPAKVKGLFGP